MMHITCSNKSQKFYSHIYVDCPFIVDAVSCEAVRGMGLKVHRYSSNNLICSSKRVYSVQGLVNHNDKKCLEGKMMIQIEMSKSDKSISI